jgi:hypothetical protein
MLKCTNLHGGVGTESWDAVACVAGGQGGTLSWPSLSGGRATQLQSGQINNLFDNLRESGSELKSEWSKRSISACPVVRRVWQLLTNQLLEGSFQRIHLHQTDHPTKESLGSNTISQFPQKLSDKKEQQPLLHSPAYQPWEGTETQRVHQKYQHLDLKSE